MEEEEYSESLSPEFQEEEERENPYNEENQEFLEEASSVPPVIAQMFLEPKAQEAFDCGVEHFAILAARCGLNAMRGGVRKPEVTEDGGFVGFFVTSLTGVALRKAGIDWETVNERYVKALTPFCDWIAEQFDAEEEG